MIDNPMAAALVEDEPEGRCDKCKADLYAGESTFCWHLEWICEECYKDLLTRMSLVDLADAMSVDVRQVGEGV